MLTVVKFACSAVYCACFCVGITLDLGFSSFTTDVPAHLSDSGYDKLQFTFVDCPGHASLIRTIMGGAGEFPCLFLEGKGLILFWPFDMFAKPSGCV